MQEAFLDAISNGRPFVKEAGLPVVVTLTFRGRDLTRHSMAEYAREASEMGVGLIGACCGSLPYHIYAMEKALAKRTNVPDAAN